MRVRRCASVASDVVCLFGWVFGVARNFLRYLREERSLDCRDQLCEEFIEGEFGEWCRRGDGVGLVW